ncbi:MAG: hypothetical protein ACOC3D_06790 [Pseudomonadota bacterium]
MTTGRREPGLEEVLAAVEGLRFELQAVRADLAALQARLEVLEAHDASAELDPETVVMLAAAVTSYLGKRVRIRAARLVSTGPDEAGTWARHGRAAIQTSHQLQRGH